MNLIIKNKETKLLMGILAICAVINACWIGSSLISMRPDDRETIFAIEYDLIPLYREIRIEIALIISTIVLLTPKTRNLLISIACLIYIQAEYVKWYFYSEDIKTQAGISYLQPSIANFYKATWWDIWILIMTIVIFGYAITFLRRNPVSQERS